MNLDISAKRTCCLTSVLTIAGIMTLFPVMGLANHHGTRCHVDFTQNKVAVVKSALASHCSTGLDIAKVEEIAALNLEEIKEQGSRRPNYKIVPAEGAAYSMPFSFTTCQIPLHQKCCQAIKWCYPYKENSGTATCGKVGVPLACAHEKARCHKYPNLAECKKPSAAKERCYANPVVKGCKR